MLRSVAAAVLIACLTAWPSDVRAQGATRGLHAEALTTVIEVLPDGSLEVNERITFRFTERMFREVERRVPIRHADALVDVAASLDGRVLPAGTGAGQAEIRTGRRELGVIWRFPETTDATHTFELQYRAVGAVRVDSGRGSVAWHVLPSRHRYAISQAEAVLHLRAPLRSLGGPAMEAEGWTWSPLPDGGWVARKSDIGVDERAILTDTFDAAGLSAATPRWQFQSERARQLAPAFVVGAVIIIVMGAGMVVMMSLRYHQPRVDGRTAVPAPFDSLPPALGTAIRSGRVTVGVGQASATFFDLLRRGVFTIEETSKAGAGSRSRTFDVGVPHGDAAVPALLPHERLVVEALQAKAVRDRLTFREAQSRLLAIMRGFRQGVRAEIHAAGLVDRERQWASEGLMAAGIVALLLGLVGIVAVALFLPLFGGAVFLVPGAVVIVGAIFIVASQAFRTLSMSGAALGAQWAARVRQVKEEVAAGRADALGEEWLAVAVAAGLGRRFGKSGVAVTWLRGVSNPPGALSAILAASSGAGGMHGGGTGMGGGTAGGGGFSGAR